MFVDSEEIQELFDEQQDRHSVSIQRESITSAGGRVIRPGRRTPQRRTYAHLKAAEIRSRLLAGERPKTSGVGRTAKVWYAVAASLGLEIEKKIPKTKAQKNEADWERGYKRVADKLKERILAGGRPRVPNRRWLRAAQELGVALPSAATAGATAGATCST